MLVARIHPKRVVLQCLSEPPANILFFCKAPEIGRV